MLKPQGIKGELKLKTFVDDLDRFYELPYVFLKSKGGYEKRQVEDVWTYKEFAFVKLSGCDDRNAAEALRGAYLYVDRENAVELPDEDTFFIADLIGCLVLNEAGGEYGRVEEVLNTGGLDIYHVKGNKSLLFPAAPGVITRVDVEGKRLFVDAKRLEEVAVDA